MKVFHWFVVFLLSVASVIVFSGIVRAGEVPDGFIGVPWGASTEQIVKAMTLRGYKQLRNDSGGLKFRGEFAGHSCELIFKLLANSFYSGLALIGENPAAMQLKKQWIVEGLSNKYGPPHKNKGSEPPEMYGWPGTSLIAKLLISI